LIFEIKENLKNYIMEEIEEELEVWEKCGESKRCNYFVTNLGQVKSVTKVNKKERIFKGIPMKNGYLDVSISGKRTLIHKLVAIAFLGERPEGLEIDHINRNKDDNRVENLRYCTKSENQRNRDNFRDDILEEDPILRKKIRNKESQKKALAMKYTCECGGKTSKHDKAKHEKTKKHINFINGL
jgi:hypothetical protein